jgi:hypothetical protein
MHFTSFKGNLRATSSQVKYIAQFRDQNHYLRVAKHYLKLEVTTLSIIFELEQFATTNSCQNFGKFFVLDPKPPLQICLESSNPGLAT